MQTGATASLCMARLGTAWKIVPNGAHSKFFKLHDFCMESACTDGSNPWSSLVIDAEGHLIGTTYFGGDMNTGTIYKLYGGSLKTFTRMVSFGAAGAPGSAPLGGLTPDSPTTYPGTTALMGANGGGDFYSVAPRGLLKPAIPVPTWGMSGRPVWRPGIGKGPCPGREGLQPNASQEV